MNEPTVNDLKCCGNCLFREAEHTLPGFSCERCMHKQVTNKAIGGYNCCSYWEYDNMTEKERMIR